MKAVINGVEVEGSVDEIRQLIDSKKVVPAEPKKKSPVHWVEKEEEVEDIGKVPEPKKRKSEKDDRDRKIKAAVVVSKEMQIGFGPAYKKLWNEEPKSGYYTVARNKFGYKGDNRGKGKTVRWSDGRKEYMAKRMHYVHNRANALMHADHSMSREQAYRQASAEWTNKRTAGTVVGNNNRQVQVQKAANAFPVFHTIKSGAEDFFGRVFGGSLQSADFNVVKTHLVSEVSVWNKDSYQAFVSEVLAKWNDVNKYFGKQIELKIESNNGWPVLKWNNYGWSN